MTISNRFFLTTAAALLAIGVALPLYAQRRGGGAPPHPPARPDATARPPHCRGTAPRSLQSRCYRTPRSRAAAAAAPAGPRSVYFARAAPGGVSKSPGRQTWPPSAAFQTPPEAAPAK